MMAPFVSVRYTWNSNGLNKHIHELCESSLVDDDGIILFQNIT